MDTTQSVLTVPDPVERWLVESDLSARLRAVQAQPTGGCNACQFADPLSDRLCTIPDISAEDFDLCVSGINYSRCAPYEAV